MKKTKKTMWNKTLAMLMALLMVFASAFALAEDGTEADPALTEAAESEAAPKEAEPEETPKPAEPEATPKPADPTAAPKPAEPTEAPKAADPTVAPKAADPTAAPKAADPTKAPKADKSETAAKTDEPIEVEYRIYYFLSNTRTSVAQYTTHHGTAGTVIDIRKIPKPRFLEGYGAARLAEKQTAWTVTLTGDGENKIIIYYDVPAERIASNEIGSEPAAEEPAGEEPAVEEQTEVESETEEPVKEEPAAEEPAEDGKQTEENEPAAEEPAKDESEADAQPEEEPAAEEPAEDGKQTEEDEPAAEEPADEEPATEEPAEDEPAGEEQTEAEPAEDEPAAETTRKVTIFSSRRSVMTPGETVYLTSKLEGFDDADEITYQWECDKGSGFEPVEGANADSYQFSASLETLNWGWRLVVYTNP